MVSIFRIFGPDKETDLMVDHLGHNEIFETRVRWPREPDEVNTAPELRIWLRRKLIMKVALFFVCYVGIGLALLLLDL